jgi:hypothetical protein
MNHVLAHRAEMIASMNNEQLEACKRAYFAHRRACRHYNICWASYEQYAVEWIDVQKREAGQMPPAPFEHEARDYQRQFLGTAAIGFGAQDRPARKPKPQPKPIDLEDYEE